MRINFPGRPIFIQLVPGVVVGQGVKVQQAGLVVLVGPEDVGDHKGLRLHPGDHVTVGLVHDGHVSGLVGLVAVLGGPTGSYTGNGNVFYICYLRDVQR